MGIIQTSKTKKPFYFYVGFFCVFSLAESGANCRVHKFKQECESVKECVWDSRGCNVGRALEAKEDGHYTKRATVEKNPLEIG